MMVGWYWVSSFQICDMYYLPRFRGALIPPGLIARPGLAHSLAAPKGRACRDTPAEWYLTSRASLACK